MSEPNRQEAPDPKPLRDLVANLRYKHGWVIDLIDLNRGQGSKGLTLRIHANVPDSYQPDLKIGVAHYMPIPPAAFDKRSWQRWLLDQVLLVRTARSLRVLPDRRQTSLRTQPRARPQPVHHPRARHHRGRRDRLPRRPPRRKPGMTSKPPRAPDWPP